MADGLGGLLGGIFSTEGLGTAVSGLGSLYSLSEEAEGAESLGADVLATIEDLAKRAGSAAEFTPYTLTGGMGDVVMKDTGVDITQPQALQDISTQALTGAETALQGLLAPRSEREAQILSAMESAREPQRERERLALEQRLYAQGRGGTSASQFGGVTPEEFARLQAIEEQRSKDVLASMTQAGQEQTQQQALVQGLLGTAYTPQTQALALLQAGADPAKLRQTAALSASEALQAGIVPAAEAETAGRKLALGYIEPMVEAYTGLLGPAITSVGQTLGAQDIAEQLGTSLESGLGDLYDRIFG